MGKLWWNSSLRKSSSGSASNGAEEQQVPGQLCQQLPLRHGMPSVHPQLQSPDNVTEY